MSRFRAARLRGEHGFTMIELVIAMALTVVISAAAFSFLEFATGDATRITERVHIDQTARVALERIMLELHSACVAPSIVPIKEKSTENVLKFVSESGKESTFSTVHEHELIFTEPTASKRGTLVEKTYVSTGGTSPNYTFSTTPSSTTLLVTGVEKSEKTPVFQYFRYYKDGDPEAVYGQIDPNRISQASLSKEASEGVAKVTLTFTVAPEGKELATFNHDRPVALEDSAVFRLAPASESSDNVPCSPQT
jgi:prepilin-type N-terminal cleavage/methylation domain-containing protein